MPALLIINENLTLIAKALNCPMQCEKSDNEFCRTCILERTLITNKPLIVAEFAIFMCRGLCEWLRKPLFCNLLNTIVLRFVLVY